MTRERKSEWVTGKVTRDEKDVLERVAAERFEGNLSAALRYVIRAADPARAPRPTRQAAGGVG